MYLCFADFGPKTAKLLLGSMRSPDIPRLAGAFSIRYKCKMQPEARILSSALASIGILEHVVEEDSSGSRCCRADLGTPLFSLLLMSMVPSDCFVEYSESC